MDHVEHQIIYLKESRKIYYFKERGKENASFIQILSAIAIK